MKIKRRTGGASSSADQFLKCISMVCISVMINSWRDCLPLYMASLQGHLPSVLDQFRQTLAGTLRCICLACPRSTFRFPKTASTCILDATWASDTCCSVMLLRKETDQENPLKIDAVVTYVTYVLVSCELQLISWHPQGKYSRWIGTPAESTWQCDGTSRPNCPETFLGQCFLCSSSRMLLAARTRTNSNHSAKFQKKTAALKPGVSCKVRSSLSENTGTEGRRAFASCLTTKVLTASGFQPFSRPWETREKTVRGENWTGRCITKLWNMPTSFKRNHTGSSEHRLDLDTLKDWTNWCSRQVTKH